MRIVVCMLCATVAALGQAPNAPVPPQTPLPPNSPGVTQPALVEKHDPQYSEEGRRARLNGTALLRIVVDEKGLPRELHVTRSLGFGLDEEAIKAVQTWRFSPGTKGDVPVPVFATVEVNFRLLPPRGNSWHLEASSLPVPEGVSRPRLISAVFPKGDPSQDTNILVSFDVNENGVPANLSVEKPGSNPSEAAVIDALNQWRFTPARKDAFAIPVHAKFTFVAHAATVDAAAAPSPVPSPSRTSAGVTQPRLLSKVEPKYSEEARKAKLEGMVELKAVVGNTGVTSDFTVAQPLGLGLDECAIAAVRQWRFSPGLKDGAPVPVVVTLQINFRLLLDHSGWHLASAAFDTAEGAARPVLTHAEFPKDPPKERAHISLSFEIDGHGEPKDLTVDKSADSKLEQEIIAAAKKWRFKPATKDGAAIPSRATFEFVASPWNPSHA